MRGTYGDETVTLEEERSNNIETGNGNYDPEEDFGNDETDSQFSAVGASYVLKEKYSDDNNKQSTAKFTFIEDERSPLIGRRQKDQIGGAKKKQIM